MIDWFFYIVFGSMAAGGIQWFFQECANIRIELNWYHRRIATLRRMNEGR